MVLIKRILIFFYRRRFSDICNKQAMENFAQQTKVNYILNCAAYTAVDKAEEIDQQAICERINGGC